MSEHQRNKEFKNLSRISKALNRAMESGDKILASRLLPLMNMQVSVVENILKDNSGS